MHEMNGQVFLQRCIVLWLFAPLWMNAAWGQGFSMPAAPYRITSRAAQSPNQNIRVTYEGTVVLNMGNYDFVLGTPNSEASLNSPYSNASQPQLIFKSDTGLRWDGRSYLYDPNSPIDEAYRNRLSHRVVGHRLEQYPPLQRQQTPTIGPPALTTTGGASTPSRDRTTPSLARGTVRGTILQPSPLPHFGPRIDVATQPENELCRFYPYSPQCQPQFGTTLPAPVQPQVPSSTIGYTMDSRSTRRSQMSEYQFEVPQIIESRPQWRRIVITNADSSESCGYTLLKSNGDEEHFELPPLQKHEVQTKGNYSIRFQSDGSVVKRYRLRNGQSYRFQKSQSDGWELRRLSAEKPIPAG